MAILAISAFLTLGGHVRPIPRTSTFEFAIPATNGNNQLTPKEVRLVTVNNKEVVTESHPPLNLPSPIFQKYFETFYHHDMLF